VTCVGVVPRLTRAMLFSLNRAVRAPLLHTVVASISLRERLAAAIGALQSLHRLISPWRFHALAIAITCRSR